MDELPRQTRLVIARVGQPRVDVTVKIATPTTAVEIVEQLVDWAYRDATERSQAAVSPLDTEELAQQLASGRVFGAQESVVGSTRERARSDAVASLRERTVELFVDDRRVVDPDAPIEVGAGAVVSVVQLGLVR